jgi:Na+-translocating ferredoxin:NAD+ oxidoreductase subunit G
MDARAYATPLILAAAVGGSVLLLALVQTHTATPIAAAQLNAERAQLAALLPPLTPADHAAWDAPAAPVAIETGVELLRRFRVSRAGDTLTTVYEVRTSRGYSGAITLQISVMPDGTLRGVRVRSHRETPGLGDPIEIERSNWILGFDRRRLGDPPRERWAVKPDGGDFDALSGATITPRAVVDAVRATLEFDRREVAN